MSQFKQFSQIDIDHDIVIRLMDNIPEIVYICDFDSDKSLNIRHISKKIEQLTGYQAVQFIDGRIKWIDIIYKKDRDDWIDAVNRSFSEGRDIDLIYRVVTANEKIIEVRDRAIALRDDDGNTIGLDGIIMDVTLQQKARREMERTQMIQSIGRLGAGIAHEINTPVQFIGDNLHFIKDSFSDLVELLKQYRLLYDKTAASISTEDTESIQGIIDRMDYDYVVEEIPKALEQSLEGVKRVSAIVAAIRDFSHIDERRMGPGDINKAIESTITLAHNEIKYVADVELDLDKNIPQINCCIDDMHQVFLNLILNAAHAMTQKVKETGEKGKIKIISRQEGRKVVVRITDTGSGIPDEVKERMYEPFFTTKGHDKGTGQGLLFVKTIVVEKHKGQLLCDTEVGAGTTFEIRLPMEGIETRTK